MGHSPPPPPRNNKMGAVKPSKPANTKMHMQLLVYSMNRALDDCALDTRIPPDIIMIINEMFVGICGSDWEIIPEDFDRFSKYIKTQRKMDGYNRNNNMEKFLNAFFDYGDIRRERDKVGRRWKKIGIIIIPMLLVWYAVIIYFNTNWKQILSVSSLESIDTIQAPKTSQTSQTSQTPQWW